MLKLFIETGNAAFADDRGPELARILRNLADKIEQDWWMTYAELHDINGNKVGECEMSDIDEEADA